MVNSVQLCVIINTEGVRFLESKNIFEKKKE